MILSLLEKEIIILILPVMNHYSKLGKEKKFGHWEQLILVIMILDWKEFLKEIVL